MSRRQRSTTPADTSAAHGDRDSCDLAGFGYRQTLDRSLGSFSSFAAGFSYLSVLTGSSQLFHAGFAAGGPAFFWTWPAVLFGQLLVALCFAELAARYPLSGGVYQWSKQVGGGAVGRTAGWVYLACAVITLGSVALALQTTLPQISSLFQVVGKPGDPGDAARNAVVLGCALVAFSTAVNAVGLRLLARLNNLGVAVEMAATVGLIALLAWAARRSPAVVFDTDGLGGGSFLGYLTGPALAASLTATFVFYGFDTAGSLAEETDDPRRKAPRAILLALISVGVAGSLLMFTALRAAPDLGDPELGLGSGGLPYIVTQSLGGRVGIPFLVAMAFSIVVCTLTVHAAAVRLVFALARDNHLPFARALATVGASSRSPVLPALVIGLAASALLAVNYGAPRVIEALASLAVVWANLAYLFVTVPLLISRLNGKAGVSPHPGLFSLGRAGLLVNTAAVVWGAFLVVNTGWPRPAVYGGGVLGRTGAVVPTVVMLAAGLTYDRLILKRREAVVLDGHRADPAPAAKLPDRRPRRRVRL